MRTCGIVDSMHIYYAKRFQRAENIKTLKRMSKECFVHFVGNRLPTLRVLTMWVWFSRCTPYTLFEYAPCE